MSTKEEQLALAEYFKSRGIMPDKAQEIMDDVSLAISMVSLQATLDKAHGGDKK